MEARVGVHSGKMPTRKRPRLGEDRLEATVASEEDVRRAHHLALLAEKPASERGLEELVFGGMEEDEGLLRRFQTSCAQVTERALAFFPIVNQVFYSCPPPLFLSPDLFISLKLCFLNLATGS